VAMRPAEQKSKKSAPRIKDCGLIPFQQALELQHELRQKRRANEIPDTVLLCEHRPVITLGAREPANRLRIEADELAARNIELARTRRGGGATAHNPGQLVFYPILDLRARGLGAADYIHRLESVGIELLRQLGVKAARRKGFVGLWVGDRKIASIGVRISRGISYHGMAININNDLSIFGCIVPCGLDGVKMTSVLAETGSEVPMAVAKQKLTELLQRHLSAGAVTLAATYPKSEPRKLPPWLRRPLPTDRTFGRTANTLKSLGLETICTNANCPNRGQCWQRGTATVLILGNICTRNCRFCSVATGKPEPPDPTEPGRIAEMVGRLGLSYLVITSVNRDDLPDGGASHFRDCVNAVRAKYRQVRFEILTPDFRNCQQEAIDILSEALPFVFAHNVETVPSLYPVARRGGDYRRSLDLLKTAKENFAETQTKSSIMLGLGETDEEVEEVLFDLRDVGCDRITVGQYLKPSRESLEVVEYVRPEKFNFWRERALQMGFTWVCSEPFARSSYLAEQEIGQLDSPV